MKNLFGKLRDLFYGPDVRAKVALHTFRQHCEQLRNSCFTIAAKSGKPRGLIWKNCDWLDQIVLVEDPQNEILTLFTAVNLSFEAVEGGDMESVEAVSMIREATAVFHFRDMRWGTGGRILFNMTPKLAAETVTPDLPVRHEGGLP